jgi:uncharacterized protein YciI
MAEKVRDSPKADVPRNLKTYFLCLLRKGPQWDDPEGQEDLMPLQLAFLRKQTEAGKILLCGPVLDQADDLTGVSIIRAATLEEAQAVAHEDPAVIAERLIAEIRPVFLPSMDGVKVEYSD